MHSSPVKRPKKAGLRHAHGKISGVIQHKNLDWQLVVDDRLQFLNIHLDAAVTGDRQISFARQGKSCTRWPREGHNPWTPIQS